MDVVGFAFVVRGERMKLWRAWESVLVLAMFLVITAAGSAVIVEMKTDIANLKKGQPQACQCDDCCCETCRCGEGK